MQVKDAVVLVTGANRGLGRTFVQTALARGAKKVYAAARHPDSIRVEAAIPIRLDVTKADEAIAVADIAGDVTLVINNAGISLNGGVVGEGDIAGLRQQLETNCFGMLHVSRAFAPVLRRNGGGALVNILSALSWMNAPALSGYCVSKAAAWMLTNGLRNELRAQGTLVVGVHAGFMDTDMASGFGGPKVSPESVAAQTFEALDAGREEVLADEPARRAQAALSSSLYLRPVAFR